MNISTVLFRFHGRINRRDYWLRGILLALLTIIGAYTLVALGLAWVVINNTDPAASMLLE
jgi:uncharacterized membrane protein YhaH (DUF805 family)